MQFPGMPPMQVPQMAQQPSMGDMGMSILRAAMQRQQQQPQGQPAAAPPAAGGQPASGGGGGSPLLQLAQGGLLNGLLPALFGGGQGGQQPAQKPGVPMQIAPMLPGGVAMEQATNPTALTGLW